MDSIHMVAMRDELVKIATEHKDKTPGGKADKKQLSDYPKDQLAMGQKVEMEHTNDPALAREISMDHLEEFKDYYTRLKKMEHEAEKAKEKKAAVMTPGSPGPGSGCSKPGRRLGQKGEVLRKFRFALARMKAEKGKEKKADGDEEGESGGRAPTATDKKAIRTFLKQRPKGQEDEEYHEFLEGRGVNVPAGEAVAYDMVGSKLGAALVHLLG